MITVMYDSSQQCFLLKSGVRWINLKFGHKTHDELEVGRSLEGENDLKKKGQDFENIWG